jgi:hypothetical protein
MSDPVKLTTRNKTALRDRALVALLQGGCSGRARLPIPL